MKEKVSIFYRDIGGLVAVLVYSLCLLMLLDAVNPHWYYWFY
ncbi:hypothetical protein BTURTLESOX_1786 [bacterium endosymbiont of Bathymodiolus sp. 5 South]|nr:hypothetical protein BTURTLESOX_1786 [bacterium endosymbiont of Bathymodiolus sp. 5 South]